MEPRGDQERLWERLQPIRTGDYGDLTTIELKPEEEAAVVRALRCCFDRVELDEDEQRLLLRLTVADDLRHVIARLDEFEDDLRGVGDAHPRRPFASDDAQASFVNAGPASSVVRLLLSCASP